MLPEFDGPTIDAKYAVLHGKPQSPDQLRAWQTVTRIADHFKSADKYLVSLPMWNFGIPYKLKHYIDVLVQPGLTFISTPDGAFKGLVTGKPLLAIYARGGAYGPGSGAETYDLQSSYLKQILGFIGFTDIREIFIEPTAASPASKEQALIAANRLAAEFAARF